MTEFEYVPATCQDDTTPTTRFNIRRFLATLPAPTTTPRSAEAMSDPAWKWTRIPNEFKHDTRIYSLRLDYPAFQFEYDEPRQNWMPNREDAEVVYNIRVRHNPHTQPGESRAQEEA